MGCNSRTIRPRAGIAERSGNVLGRWIRCNLCSTGRGIRQKDQSVFFASEVPYLEKMSAAELRRRYEDKLKLGGGWIRGRSGEQTKH